ncbi:MULTISPECIES: ABC transporter permease [Oscillatoriales]|uniref:Polyamine transporter subunit membrane component of ABC superfamily n=3 Tax=Limnospira TaxID=2596745 RepID=A0A9P1KED6_9CYAN|nr:MULTISPECIES: ABC transporter permease [Oscillatoriales]AMW30390.1 spermidine/putrescine ABC transporter permease [Arthrospira platensis YZ]EKD06148.1 binding-protein-dependent transport systems inner membranecomponent [Arthrospira platensis C1]KDR59185.1 spermidine/putrescine ABC transporter permease [Arthrospira platensis str. Paraca]MBD2668118.1 ABC transporter permease [Arthrospira platensis FACHB-439]MBD2709171.1 ABC transporter permease [Arthrospira platensis FACHB-835]MDC0836295.1 A
MIFGKQKASSRLGETVGVNKRIWLIVPATVWLVIFFVVPLVIVLIYSFLERGTYGGVVWSFTVGQYQRLLNPLYLRVFMRSLELAAFTTIICLAIAYPFAFFIATRPRGWRNLLLMLVIIPFWTNFLVRTYAWMIILRDQGVVNTLLQNLHLIDEPLNLLFTPFAVLVGLIYGYLPFMILPLYVTWERFDFSLIEAAQDLGANDIRTVWRVLLPLTRRGIIAGSILVFIPALGAFITPDILGGSKTVMIGNLIQNQFLQARHWPLGSALSILLMMLVIIPVWVYFQMAENRQ